MRASRGSLPIIPVLDLLGGQAVHAVRGNRSNYQPLTGLYAPAPDPNAILMALEPLIPSRVAYVADLDAIQGREPNTHLLHGPVQRGWTLWLDAGLREEVPNSFPPGIIPIVGTETIRSPDVLKGMLANREDLLISVDLRGGIPFHIPDVEWPNEPALALVERVIRSGARKLILLDLAVVGSSEGPSHLDLARQIRTVFPQVEVYLGGGIRGIPDLVACQQAGLAGVLVATALQTGALNPWLVR